MSAENDVTTLIEQAEAWQAQDPDPDTSLELGDLIARASAGDAEAIAGLHARFDTRLAFGTAGLRGEMGAGPNRMNRVLVSQAAAGLAAHELTGARDLEGGLLDLLGHVHEARGRRQLGDIVVCAPLVAREAREQGKALRAHWAHMIIHGTLHLLGFDHVRAADARRMEGRERVLLARLGIGDPYAD